MNDRALGAVALLRALDGAAHSFRDFGYARFLDHRSVRWRLLSSTGFADHCGAAVGVAFQLDDGREVCLVVEVRVRNELFEVTGDVMIDETPPEEGQRFLCELTEIRTDDVDDCVAAVAAHTAELCSYTSVLTDLGVPGSRNGADIA